MPRTTTIGVFGHVGNDNQGDEALIAATVQNIRSRRPEATIVGFTLNPEDTRRRHGIAAFSIRWPRAEWSAGRPAAAPAASAARVPSLRHRVELLGKRIPWLHRLLRSVRSALSGLAALPRLSAFLYRSYRHLRSLDLLIVAGSQQCNDVVGPWNFPLRLFTWSLLCRLANTKLAFVSVGAGPLSARWSRFFVRQALRGAAYRSFRDEASRQLARAIGVRGDLHVFPDLVYSLKLPPAAPRSPRAVQAGSGLVVGINPLPLYSPFYWLGHDMSAHARYIDVLATFAAGLLRDGHTVVVFPTQFRVDPPVVQELHLAIKRLADAGTDERLYAPTLQTFEDLVSMLATLDVAVVTRFHGVVLSHLLGLPALAIAYATKTREVMRAVGHGDCVIAVEDLDVGWLARRFASLAPTLSAVRGDIRAHTAVMRDSLDRQYDDVLALVDAGRPRRS